MTDDKFCEYNILVKWAGSKGKFSAGFDVTVFGGSQGKRSKFGQM